MTGDGGKKSQKPGLMTEICGFNRVTVSMWVNLAREAVLSGYSVVGLVEPGGCTP